MFSYNDGSPTLMTEGRATVTSGVGGGGDTVQSVTDTATTS